MLAPKAREVFAPQIGIYQQKPNGASLKIMLMSELLIVEQPDGEVLIQAENRKKQELAQWIPPNTGATNSNGFIALHGGFRIPDGYPNLSG